jgi:chromosome segregation ATPase
MLPVTLCYQITKKKAKTMKLEGINYEDTVVTINEMLKAGEKITVRNIRSRTGGKNSTVAEFKKRWEDEQKIEITEDILSDDLKRAIIADRNNVVQKIKESYETKIKNLENRTTEEHDLLKEQENTSKKLTEELENIKLQSNAEITKLSVQIEGLNQLNAEIKAQLENAQAKLETISVEKHTALKDAAVWESKYTELKGQTNR